MVTFPLTAITSRTPTTRDALADQLAAVARDGFALQVGELDPDRACIAVGVRSPGGTLVAALAHSGRADQAEIMTRQVPAMTEYATRLAPLLA